MGTLSRTKRFSLGDYVLLSCVPFANLPFMQVNIFQSLKLIAHLIVQAHCKATKEERE